METNIISILNAQVDFLYNLAQLNAQTFTNQQMYKTARRVIESATNQALGAVMIASRMCLENGYLDLSKKITDKWNNVFDKWFTDLVNNYC